MVEMPTLIAEMGVGSEVSTPSQWMTPASGW